MGKTQLRNQSESLTSFTDVIFLSDKVSMPTEIKRLFRQKKLSYCHLALEQFSLLRCRPDLIGTVLVDAEGFDTTEDPEFGRIIESLEKANIGTILLTQRVSRPVKSFSLASSESSFSLNETSKSVSVEDLWAQIRVNLAHRKQQDPGITVIPPAINGSCERVWKRRLASQLESTDSLIDSLTEQLRLAGLVQRDFLPSQLPNSDRARWAVTFMPAEWVSGDIYDVARIDEQHVGFYLADAVGHSMPAALLTIFIKQALVMRETIGNDYRIFAPDEVMKNLNLRMVGQKLSGHQFATCCYCLLNVETRELSLARGGHPYPILLRPGQQPEQLQTRGSLLGVFDNAEFTGQTIQLHPGDRLLLYSDGAESLIGTATEDNFQYAPDLLAVKDASLTEIIDRLTDLANNRAVDPAELDDLTLLGLEIP